MKTVRMRMIRFNDNKTVSGAFQNTDYHLSRISCDSGESCEFGLYSNTLSCQRKDFTF